MTGYGVESCGDRFTDEKGTPLSNFSVRAVKKFYEAEDQDTPGILRVTILHAAKTCPVDIDLKNPNIFQQIQQTIPTCKILRSRARASIEAHILELPVEAEAQETLPPLCFRKHGFHKLPNGAYVFVTGDEVLGLPAEQDWIIVGEAARPHLVWDASLSLRQAVRGLLEALDRYRKHLPPIWGFTLISSMRSLLSGQNITTFPSVAVIGRQGCGKTTACRRFSLLYDDNRRLGRRWAEVDCGSRPAGTVDVLSNYRDQVVLLEDGAKSISKTQMRERKELIGNVLRFASNDTDRVKMDSSGHVKEQYCTAGLIFTGEFPLDNPSDLSRTLLIQIDQQMQDGKEDDRIFAATSFRYFILWMLPQICEVTPSLAAQLDHISGSDQRLEKNRMMILWALRQFLNFALANNIITEQETDNLMGHAVSACDAILDQQIEQINQMGNRNLSWYIWHGIEYKKIKKISPDDLANAEKIPSFYYIPCKRTNTICIPSEVLYNYCTKHTPLRFSSRNTMDQQLIAEGVIRCGKERRAASKKINGHRYLEIYWLDLIKSAQKEA